MFPSKVFGSRSRLCNSLGNSSPLLSTVFTHLTTAVVVVSSVVANSDVGITVVVSWNGIFFHYSSLGYLVEIAQR